MKILEIINTQLDTPIDDTELLNGILFISNQLTKLDYICTLKNKNLQFQELMKLKTPDNLPLLTEKQAIFIINYKLKSFCNLKTNYQSILSNLSIINNQLIGGSDENVSKKNVEAFNTAEKEIKDKISYIYEKVVYILNWIFFPLASAETIPVTGIFLEMYLDFITTLLNMSELFWGTVGEMFPAFVDTLLDVGQAIPAAGTVISIIAVPLNWLMIPIQYLIENMSGIMNMFLNISRKNWGLAYLDAVEVIPFFGDMMDIFITNLVIINKNFARLNEFIESSEETIEKIQNVIDYIDNLIFKIINFKNIGFLKLDKLKDVALKIINTPIVDGSKEGMWGKVNSQQTGGLLTKYKTVSLFKNINSYYIV